VDATVGTVGTVTVITAAVAGAETSAPRRASRPPKRPRSDGRQAGHGGRPRATGAGVLRVVRRLPGVRAGDSASVAWARAPWPARLAPSPRRPGLVGRRCRPGGLAVPEAGSARARAGRSARRQSGDPDRGRATRPAPRARQGSHGVAGILAWPGRYSRHLGRELPIATEGRADGGTDYYMDPEIATLFTIARDADRGR
jgi:hypothetical protein